MREPPRPRTRPPVLSSPNPSTSFDDSNEKADDEDVAEDLRMGVGVDVGVGDGDGGGGGGSAESNDVPLSSSRWEPDDDVRMGLV